MKAKRLIQFVLGFAMKEQSNTRRLFLQQLALSASALAVTRRPASARPARERLGVALVGLGHYSTALLAPALQRTTHCYLAGIVTGTPAKAEQWQKRYGLPDKAVYDYANFDQIANNPAIDVVYIVLPNSLHAEYAMRAARAGKHVWCEKPMAMNVGECQAMIDACRNHKLALAIGYRMQHEPNTQTVIRYGKERAYGRVKSISAAAGFYDSHRGHWRHKRRPWGAAPCTIWAFIRCRPRAIAAVRSPSP